MLRFLLDQCTDARLIAFLVALGHDVQRIGRHHPRGLPDTEVLAIAHREQRILITDDRDFGELVFRLSHPHSGVIFLRLGDDADLHTKEERLNYVLTNHAAHLDRFLVVELHRVRVIPEP